MKSTPFIILANSADDGQALVLDNDVALGNDGWALLAPYGEHRKERIALVNGAQVRQTFLQVVDETAVNDLLANEGGASLFQRIKRAVIKRPVFKGHPDLKQHAPETVAVGNDRPSPIGVVDANRKTARGFEAQFALTEEGARAVENEGCKFPSALWLVKPTGEVRDGATVVRPFKILSVGLTATPNISGVDSLANAKTNTPAAVTTEKKDTDNMKQLLIGWLAAQGIALANDATEQSVFDAFQKHLGEKTTSLTALGNDKQNLTTTVNTLTTDRDAQKKRADEAALALANEQTAFKAERKARCEAIVDLHVNLGRIAVADRDGEVNKLVALANDKLAEAITAMEKLPVKHKVATALGNERKEAASVTRTASEQILALANEDARYKGQPFTPALYAKILAENPALKEQLNAQPATATK